MEKNKKSSFYFGTIFLLIAVFTVSDFKIANACATVDEYMIKTSKEKGFFEMPRKYFNWAQLDFPRDKYPGKIEVYFDGEKLNELNGYPDGVSFQMGDYFPQSYRGDYSLKAWFPRTVSVRILQDGKEFYSAKWKIYDNNRNNYLLDFLSPFMILFLTAVTFFAVIWAILSNLIAVLGRWKIKAKIVIPLLILDIIVIIIYVSSQRMLC